VLRDAAAVLFTSEEERLEARKSFWLYRCREEVVGFGIDAPPDESTLPPDLFLSKFPGLRGRRLILFLGRMHVKKGCDLLLRAFRQAMDTGAAKNAHLIMAGPCENEYGAEMRRLAGDLGLDERVTWTGMISGNLKWSAFHAAEAFILPSHQENFGVSVAEALACGRPALISDKVNIWREITADEAGLVENDDEAGTRRLLERWLGMDEARRRTMSVAAKSCFTHHFVMTNVARRFVSLMHEIDAV